MINNFYLILRVIIKFVCELFNKDLFYNILINGTVIFLQLKIKYFWKYDSISIWELLEALISRRLYTLRNKFQTYAELIDS